MKLSKVIKAGIKYICDKDYRFIINATLGFYNNMADEKYLKSKYKACFKKELNLENPQTFNEKLQWLKLYDRRHIYTSMVDKFTAKEYVSQRIGEEYVIPNVAGPWSSFDEIDFDLLPEQFVLKTTHDCGGVVICKDKKLFNKKKAKKFIEKHLKTDYYLTCREWPYKNVEPRIFAEEYMKDENEKNLSECTAEEQLTDYKFFCFDGKVKALFVATDRSNQYEETKFDFFDEKYNHLDIVQGHPNAKTTPKKPQSFELMKSLASKLSEGIPQVRVDFYQVGNRVYVGELTLFHFSGDVPFQPEEWDYKFGEWIMLPAEKTRND